MNMLFFGTHFARLLQTVIIFHVSLLRLCDFLDIGEQTKLLSCLLLDTIWYFHEDSQCLGEVFRIIRPAKRVSRPPRPNLDSHNLRQVLNASFQPFDRVVLALQVFGLMCHVLLITDQDWDPLHMHRLRHLFFSLESPRKVNAPTIVDLKEKVILRGLNLITVLIALRELCATLDCNIVYLLVL